MRARPGLAAAVAFPLWALLAPAQEPVAPPSVREDLEVNVVSFEIAVTDATGLPVPDLKPSELHVTDDGTPVEVVNLALLESPSAGPVGATAAEPAAAPKAPPTSIVVFLDNSTAKATQRNAVLQELRPVLEQHVTSGRGSVMVLTGSVGVRVLQGLTTSAEALGAALERAAGEPGGASGIETGMLSGIMDRPPTGQFAAEDAEQQLVAMQAAAQGMYERGRSYLKSLDGLLTSLRTVPGRKVVLWVGEGLQLRPGEQLLKKWEVTYQGAGGGGAFSASMEATRFSLTPEFSQLQRRAAESGARIVSVNTARGGSSGGSTAEGSSMELAGAVGAASMERMGQEQTLNALARSTGGAAVLDGGNIKGRVERALTVLQSGYSVGIADPHPGDGKHHRLDVTVRREGVRVLHPEGYLDETTEGRAVQACLGALYLDAGGNPLGVTLAVKSATPQGKDRATVVLLATVPLGNVLLAPQGDSHAGKLALWLASRDGEGSLRQSTRQELPVRIPNASLPTALNQNAGYTFRMELPHGRHRTAVTVLDELGRQTSTAVLKHTVGEVAP